MYQALIPIKVMINRLTIFFLGKLSCGRVLLIFKKVVKIYFNLAAVFLKVLIKHRTLPLILNEFKTEGWG